MALLTLITFEKIFKLPFLFKIQLEYLNNTKDNMVNQSENVKNRD